MSDVSVRLGAVLKRLVGECRYCGCHGGECAIGGGEVCGWLDELKTLCSNPSCAWRAARESRKSKKRRSLFR
jgi:hypothetical protein